MQIAFFLYDDVTALDAVGPHEVLSRIAGAETLFVAERPGVIRCDNGLGVVADVAIDDVMSPDVLVMPGWSGSPQAALLAEGPVREWLRAVDQRTTWTVATCTGALVLGSAGLLKGRRATTHWLAFDDLATFGAIPTEGRVVVDGKYVTGAGGAAGIDMALTLTAAIAGLSAAQAIELALEYDPEPPFGTGCAAKAPTALVQAMRSVKDFIVFGGTRAGDRASERAASSHAVPSNEEGSR